MRMRQIAARLLLLVICAAAFHVARAEAGSTAAQQPPRQVATAPVVLHGKTLFQVPGILSFSAATRAEAIATRITSVYQDVNASHTKITVSDAERTSDVAAGDVVLLSVTESDAELAGKPRHDLAEEYAGTISVALEQLRKDYSVKTITLGSIYAVLATIVLLAIFKAIAFLFGKLFRQVEAWRGTRIPSLRIQKFEILPADRIADFVIGLAKLLRLALVLVVLYFYVSLLLGFFPWTRDYAQVLIGYIVAPLQSLGHTIVAYLPDLFSIAVIVLVAFYIIKFTRIIFLEIGKGSIAFSGFHPEWAEPTYKIARFLILAITGVAVFPYLPGAKSPAFQGISIFLGLLLSLGSTSAVANIVAGVILTYMRAFRLGDRVQIADTVGDVTEVSLLVTRVRTIKNVEITIANSMVLSSHIINFSGSVQEEGLVLHTTVTIGYDAPWRQIHELLIAAAQATENIQKVPAPFVLQTALDDFYVHYQINAFTDQPARMAKTYSDLHQNIQDKFNEAGVEIMSPHFSTLRDGNPIAIPEQYLPKGYKAPSFRVGMENVRGDRE